MLKKYIFDRMLIVMLLFCVFYASFGLAQDNQMINNLDVNTVERFKVQGIEPHITYFQTDFLDLISSRGGYPQTKLYLTTSELENNRDIVTKNYFSISAIELNDNYLYSQVTRKKRVNTAILYPSEPFEDLDDGVYYYALDQQSNLHPLSSFDDALELPCYLRVDKRDEDIASIQKSCLALITRSSYGYWPNGQLKETRSERLDLNGTVIYSSFIQRDSDGKLTSLRKENHQTGEYSVYTIIDNNGVYAIEDYFNKQGIKTHHLIMTGNLGNRIENQYLNEKGEIIDIVKNERVSIFNLSQNFAEEAPYNSLITDVERDRDQFVDRLVKSYLVQQTNPKWDQEAMDRAIYFGIQANSSYYHQTPFPTWANRRYKNYPHQAPLTLIQAENQPVASHYSDLIKVEIGENYQYKTIFTIKHRLENITLATEQFKSLENGIYYFTRDLGNKLSLITDIEQIVELPSYIRVTKIMGKIDSIVEKSTVLKSLREYEYTGNAVSKLTFSIYKNDGTHYVVLEDSYDENGIMIKTQIQRNEQGNPVKICNSINKDGIYATLELFNNDGLKTNHIIILEEDLEIKNQHLDAGGNVIRTTGYIRDEEGEPIEWMAVFADQFENTLIGLSSVDLSKQKESK